MEKLKPFEKLDEDYYMGGGGWRDDDSAEEASSDDEIQAELRKLAGIPKCDKKRGEPKGEFETDMEDELDQSICDYANEHMGGKLSQPTSSKALPAPNQDVEMKEEPSTLRDGEEEENPIIKLANKAKQDADKEIEEVEFYDPEEDDDNEKWVAEMMKKASGGGEAKTTGKIDNDSDAVLSCPGCMSLLTRDCQRHELYKDQYRAMFVENCTVDTAEQLTIEKTGKEKRRQKQNQKKGLATGSAASQDDLFYPVRCQTCKTKVAVIDNDEVYHFFNVLTGYA